jgi:polyketide cyclase/dehydrase/lipid transport protein
VNDRNIVDTAGRLLNAEIITLKRRPMLGWTALLILAAVGGVLAFAATRPDRIRMQRTVDIHAAPERIFPLINDLRNWPHWSAQDESAITRTFGQLTQGKGAASEWVGRGSAGAGGLEIVDSVVDRKVTVIADFVRPFHAHNVNEFTLEPHGDVTRVTWSWDGTNVFIAKVMSIFVSPDKMMGSHFESGLQSLKSVAEARR